MSDNFFLYNRQFPSYKPLKSVTVGSGRVGSGQVGSGRVRSVHDGNRFYVQKEEKKLIQNCSSTISKDFIALISPRGLRLLARFARNQLIASEYSNNINFL